MQPVVIEKEEPVAAVGDDEHVAVRDERDCRDLYVLPAPLEAEWQIGTRGVTPSELRRVEIVPLQLAHLRMCVGGG